MDKQLRIDKLLGQYNRAISGEAISSNNIRELLICNDPISCIEELDEEIRIENKRKAEHVINTNGLTEAVFSKENSDIEQRAPRPFHEIIEKQDQLTSFKKRLYEVSCEYIRELLKYHCVFGDIPKSGSLLYFGIIP